MEIEKAEGIRRDLVTKREALVTRGVELDQERQQIAFAAHTGDKAARKKLDDINAETAKHTSELASVDAAIAEAAQRVETARTEAERKADVEAATALKEVVKEFGATGKRMSAALQTFVDEAQKLSELALTINQLGSPNPNARQVQVIGKRPILTAIRQTVWARDFEPIAPLDRVTFEQLIDGWCRTIETNIRARLGEENKQAA